MLIDGFGIGGYRSFGALQRIGPCGKINLLVGQNNSGKSNILLFLNDRYQDAIKSIRDDRGGLLFHPLERHLGNGSSPQLSLYISQAHISDFIDSLEAGIPQRIAKEALTTDSLRPTSTNGLWLTFNEAAKPSTLRLDPKLVTKLSNELSPEKWNKLWRAVTGQIGASVHAWITDTLSRMYEPVLYAPSVSLIPAIRRIDAGGGNEDDHSGIGLIQKLARLQNPSIEERHLRKRFDNINRFLQNVIGNSDATLEVPVAQDMVLVHMDGRTLPLGHLGTGIHEVTILAVAATALSNQVICIEEPELHLHPVLQKKLVRYLQAETDNQYFLTTHSAHLLDTPGAAIFHIRLQDGATTVERVEGSPAKSRVCVDLGYRASDLLQANCVIWVEGPSDRIYLSHWIKAVDPDLVEGVHYSIMFYGGRLLSHLTANDPEVTEFISLRRLNRYISIVIDSDRSTSGGRLNDTKRRVRNEFDQGPGFAWITKGREIENYLRTDVLEKAVKEVHPSFKKLVSSDQFAHATHYKAVTGRKTYQADKVKVAHQVVKEPADLSVLDLEKKVREIVSFVHEANDV